jgi:lipopolysaccharide transport system permease protein
MTTVTQPLTRPKVGSNPFPSLWQHRNLIAQLIRREIGQRYRGSYLGLLWSFIVPLSMLLVYTFVFSVVLKARWGQATGPLSLGEYALTLFAGLVPVNMFAEVANRAPELVLRVPNYVKKVIFPLEILPVVAVGSALVNALIGIVIWFVGCVAFLHFVSPTWILLPLAFLPLMLLCLGLGWFLASLGVYVRDIGQGIGVAVQMLFFLSPVFYSTDSVPGPWRLFLDLNPMTTIISGFRRTLLWRDVLPWGPWAGWTAITAVLALLGYWWFMKTKKGFADVM